MRYYIFIIFFILLLLASSGQGAERKIVVDSLVVCNNQLCLSYHIDGLLNNNTIQGLERGLTSEVLHHIRLWKSKKLFSSISAEALISIKILYDNWEDKFRLVTDTENRLTTQVETVRQFCSEVRNYVLADIGEMEAESKYYISVETTFKPVSAETYEDLNSWLSGKSGADSKEKPKTGGQNKVFSVLMNVMGFGDKVLSYKSVDFIIENNSIRYLN
ncbi:MAG TPA: DUF4390 domain-containing protein [bacterium]|nr:DUF4390 domain-containing protein [bacterium]HPN44281.1 DUF4390 domain-containing protein [bacterium]